MIAINGIMLVIAVVGVLAVGVAALWVGFDIGTKSTLQRLLDDDQRRANITDAQQEMIERLRQLDSMLDDTGPGERFAR